jgi:hypothetical protein
MIGVGGRRLGLAPVTDFPGGVVSIGIVSVAAFATRP